jgi:rhodanese-related sulfurtransferase
MTYKTIDPDHARRLIDGGARLVDVRNADERARVSIPGAVAHPLDAIAQFKSDGSPVVFHCRSGMRTDAYASRLAQAAAPGDCYLLDGGIEAWRKAGLAVSEDRAQPLEIMRQVQIAAGSLVLIGVILGLTVSPWLLGIAGFVGAGLTFAGVSGFCGMARLLMLMPWNRRAPLAA